MHAKCWAAFQYLWAAHLALLQGASGERPHYGITGLSEQNSIVTAVSARGVAIEKPSTPAKDPILAPHNRFIKPRALLDVNVTGGSARWSTSWTEGADSAHQACHAVLFKIQQAMADYLVGTGETRSVADAAAEAFTWLKFGDAQLSAEAAEAVQSAMEMLQVLARPSNFADGNIGVFWSGFWQGADKMDGKLYELRKLVHAHSMYFDDDSFALTELLSEQLAEGRVKCKRPDAVGSGTNMVLMEEARCWWNNYSTLFSELAWRSSHSGKFPLVMVNNKPFVTIDEAEKEGYSPWASLEKTYFVDTELPRLRSMAAGRTTRLRVFTTHADCSAIQAFVQSRNEDAFDIHCTECTENNGYGLTRPPSQHLSQLEKMNAKMADTICGAECQASAAVRLERCIDRFCKEEARINLKRMKYKCERGVEDTFSDQYRFKVFYQQGMPNKMKKVNKSMLDAFEETFIGVRSQTAHPVQEGDDRDYGFGPSATEE